MTGQFTKFTWTIFTHLWSDWDPETSTRLKDIKGMICQTEICPTTKKIHWQGYTEIKSRCGFKAFSIIMGLPYVKKVAICNLKTANGDEPCNHTSKEHERIIPAFHVESSKGSPQQNIDYCSKLESRAPIELYKSFIYGSFDPITSQWDVIKNDILSGKSLQDVMLQYPDVAIKYSNGLAAFFEACRPKQIKPIPKTWLPWQQGVIDLCKTTPDERSIWWIWESTGGCGKTTITRHLVDSMSAFSVNSGKSQDLAYAWKYEKIIVFDLVRSQQENINWSILESFKNGSVFSPKYNSCVKNALSPHVICFANFPPDIKRLSADRWKIFNILVEDDIQRFLASVQEITYKEAINSPLTKELNAPPALLVPIETKGSPEACNSQACPPFGSHISTGGGNSRSPPLRGNNVKDLSDSDINNLLESLYTTQ